MTPTQSALMLTPMALINIGLAPVVGRLVDRVHPRLLAVPGLLLFSLAIFLYVRLLDPTVAWGILLIPGVVLGFANALTWAPISSTATRGLPPRQAGAGSGIYNTTRQVGGVIGSAAISVLIQARLAADLPSGGGSSSSELSYSGTLPAFLRQDFTDAMAQSLLLPAFVILIGAIAVAFFVRPTHAAWTAPSGAPASQPQAVPSET
jgi:MFS family permease